MCSAIKPQVIWLTGLSGAGKSTIAQGLATQLKGENIQTYVLDGDELRTGLNSDLGFSEQDRTENIRRTAEVAKLLVKAGIVVIAALISPYERDRQNARKLFSNGEFTEVFIDTPIEICIERDPKGLYQKARGGEIANFTGIDAPYEIPTNPDVILKAHNCSANELIKVLLDQLLRLHQKSPN